MFLTKCLYFPNRYRPWEKSLRRFNKRRRWNLISWLTKTTYENLKFKNGWKTTSFINPAPRDPGSRDKTTKYCDMEKLHEQDSLYYKSFT